MKTNVLRLNLILTSRSHPGNDTYINISDHGTSDAGRQRNVALKA